MFDPKMIVSVALGVVLGGLIAGWVSSMMKPVETPKA